MQAQNVFETKPLMRQHQVEETKAEIKTMQEQLASPHVEEKGVIAQRLRRVSASLEAQTPRAPQSVEEEARMVKRSEELLASITQGMPSQEEMRKAPPGAIDKHAAWEKRNKPAILEWKNLQLRLKPGEREAANLERHRPVTSSLNMQNALIPGKQYYLPPEGVAPSVTFSDAELAILREKNPQAASLIGLMTNEQRAVAKQELYASGMFDKAGKKPMTAEEKKDFAAKMSQARAAKRNA